MERRGSDRAIYQLADPLTTIINYRKINNKPGAVKEIKKFVCSTFFYNPFNNNILIILTS